MQPDQESFIRKIKLNSYQDKFIFDDKHKYIFLKSGWATGKSMCLILACVSQCEKYPKNLGIVYRKEATDLRDSTIKQFEDLTGRKVSSHGSYEFPNGSTILFRHEENLGTVQNVNLGFAGIEEHAEIDSDNLFFTLFGRLRRDNTGLKLYSVGNANGHNWVYKIKQNGLYDPSDTKKENRLDLHLEATTFDNSHNLPKSFIDSLQVLKVNKPHFYNRFVMNSDEESDSADLIISVESITKAMGRELYIIPPIKKVVSIDVSRYGDDKTVFIAIENNCELEKQVHEKKSTMETVGLALAFAKKHQIDSFAVDEIGVGGGVADRLAELEKDVIFVNAAERKDVRTDCYNRRAEIYLHGAELFNDGKVSILKSDVELAEQLSWAKYKTIKSNGVYQVEPKDDIKARYGRSPDDADAFLNGLWALPQVKPSIKVDKYIKSVRDRELVGSGSGMTI